MAPPGYTKTMRSMRFSERLFSRIEVRGDAECWEWTGPRSGSGYGKLARQGKHVSPHRMVYEHCRGTIPSGMVVMHLCDNRACCNPDHLSVGTPADNIRDMMSKGRQGFGRVPTTVHHRASLSRLDVDAIRSLRGTVRQRDLASRYGVSQTAISKIQRGVNWRWFFGLRISNNPPEE